MTTNIARWTYSAQSADFPSELHTSGASVARLEQIIGLFPSEYRKLGEPYRIMPDYDYSRQIDGARVMYTPKGLRFEDFSDVVSGYLR